MTGMRRAWRGAWILGLTVVACGPKHAAPEPTAQPAPAPEPEATPESAWTVSDEPLLPRSERMPWSRCGGLPVALRTCTPYTCEHQDNRGTDAGGGHLGRFVLA